jgi:prevent-host-death family protein
MSRTSNIKPISYFKANATEMLSDLRETQQPYVITQNGEAAAVLVDPTEYDRMIEAIELLKLVQHGEEDLRMKRTMSPEQARTRLTRERARRSTK